MKSLPTRTSSAGCAPRPRRRTMTCSTACERDDVLLVAVGSCVRCRLPLGCCKAQGARCRGAHQPSGRRCSVTL
ncbi:TPA: hypothetical protein BOS_23161 [Bos taurus]|nr:TPA: hypothetical protein BOS_23161 [Bos taurus]